MPEVTTRLLGEAISGNEVLVIESVIKGNVAGEFGSGNGGGIFGNIVEVVKSTIEGNTVGEYLGRGGEYSVSL